MITILLAFVQSFDQARLDAAREHLNQHIRQGHLAGAVTLVMHNGKTVAFDALGYADLETKAPMMKDTIFQVMSMTKPVTATAAMICVEKGLLSLDDPVEKYLPQFEGIKVKGPDGTLVNAKSKPTLRHLMMHTSGIASDDPGGISDEAKAKLPLKEYSKLLGTEPLNTQPGEVIRYSGVGFSTLASIIEIVTKTHFDDFVNNEIFKPLGMSDTYFFLPDKQRSRLAQVYGMDKGKLVPFDNDRFRPGAQFANGAGGLYSTAQDMGKFIEAFRDAKKSPMLSRASINLMTTLQTGDLLSDGNTARGYGLSWSVVRGPAGQTTLRSTKSFGHTGAFGTEFWHDRETGITLVFMAQTFFIPEDARKQFSTMINASYR